MKSEMARQRKLLARKRKRQEMVPKRGHSNRIEYFSPRFKMSEVIAHLAEPLLVEVGNDRRAIKNMIRCVTLAWNVTMLPDEQREKAIRKHGITLFRKRVLGKQFCDSEEAMNTFRKICEVIEARKDQYYPGLKAFIIDVHFPEYDPDREKEEGIYFEVAYAHK